VEIGVDARMSDVTHSRDRIQHQVSADIQGDTLGTLGRGEFGTRFSSVLAVRSDGRRNVQYAFNSLRLIRWFGTSRNRIVLASGETRFSTECAVL
jgi:hypothetical protein